MKDLFKSKTSYAILDMLVNKPNDKYTLGDIVKCLHRDGANVMRELDKLSKQGVVNIDKKSGKNIYSFNRNYRVANELMGLFKKINSLDFDKKFKSQWLLGEEIINVEPYFIQMLARCLTDGFAIASGREFKKVSVIFKGYHIWLYFDDQDVHELADLLVKRFLADPDFMAKANKEIVKTSDQLGSFADQIPEENLDKQTNSQLWKMLEEYDRLHTQSLAWGWISVAADMMTGTMTEAGKAILRNLKVSEKDMSEFLVLLTEPTKPSLVKTEQVNLRRIGIMVQKDKEQTRLFQELFYKFKEQDVKMFGLYTHSPEYEAQFEKRVHDLLGKIKPKIMTALQRHYLTYFYTKFIFTEEQGVYTFEHYLKELVRLVNRTPVIEAELEEEEARTKETVDRRADLIGKLKLTAKQRTFFDGWGEFMVTKIYRRYAQLITFYKTTAIIEEVGRRIGRTLKQTRSMKPEEIKAALFDHIAISSEEIDKRIQFAVFYCDKNEQNFYTGKEAEEIAQLIRGKEASFEDVKEIKGQTGCHGHAVGVVKIVNVIDDMQKMKVGDILVSKVTQPDLLPAMKKAAAFVTEQGGVTSHAAIVARELHVPCVIGTKIATKVLRDGMRVEVDASSGIVKILDT